METRVAVAKMKNRLSEYIAKSAYAHERFVITKREKPIAALINMEDLQLLEQIEERRGLTSVVGQWNGVEDLEDCLGDIRNLRREMEGAP